MRNDVARQQQEAAEARKKELEEAEAAKKELDAKESEENKQGEPEAAADQPDGSKFSVTVTQQGEGYKLQKYDTVRAHYSGTLLNGEKFDSSYDRGQPLPFKVGNGQVIKCWDEGFLGLAQGAKAKLVCPPDYAYGSRSMGKIASNSVLLFDIEVVDIV